MSSQWEVMSNKTKCKKESSKSVEVAVTMDLWFAVTMDLDNL